MLGLAQTKSKRGASCCCSCIVLIIAVAAIAFYSVQKLKELESRSEQIKEQPAPVEVEEVGEVTVVDGIPALRVSQEELGSLLQQYMYQVPFINSSSTKVELDDNVATVTSELSWPFTLPVSMTIVPTTTKDQIEVDKVFISSFRVPDAAVQLLLDSLLRDFTQNVKKITSEALQEVKLNIQEEALLLMQK